MCVVGRILGLSKSSQAEGGTMSRKDYEALAAAIADANGEPNDLETVRDVAEHIADALQADNPRFDRGRFLGACGFPNKSDICERAEQYGYRAGVAAGSWVIDGNTSVPEARYLLAGIEEGDPVVIESLPSSPLSGEWAGSLLPADILAEYGIRENDPAADDVLSAFEDGYSRGVTDEVIRAARLIVS